MNDICLMPAESYFTYSMTIASRRSSCGVSDYSLGHDQRMWPLWAIRNDQ